MRWARIRPRQKQRRRSSAIRRNCPATFTRESSRVGSRKMGVCELWGCEAPLSHVKVSSTCVTARVRSGRRCQAVVLRFGGFARRIERVKAIVGGAGFPAGCVCAGWRERRVAFTRESEVRVPGVVLRRAAVRDMPVLGCGSMMGCLWSWELWSALKLWVLNGAECGVR